MSQPTPPTPFDSIHRDPPPPPRAEGRAMPPGEEVIVTSATGGRKGRKLASVSSLDPKALLALAEVSGFGARKYDAHNYLRGYDWSLSFDALHRHLLAFWAGQDTDPESGMPHVAHAAWHCLALLSFQTRGIGTDDRPPASPPEVGEAPLSD